jgi:dimethylamine monooxygenase subunit A
MSFDFSLVSAPFRMQPGLRRIDTDAAQLTAGTPNGRHLREKMAVLASFPSQALCAVDGFDVVPVLRTIAGEAARTSPCAFELDESAAGVRCRAPLLGWSIDDDKLPIGDGDPAIGKLLRQLPPAQRAVALPCLAFEEDFAVLDGPSATVPWLAVCLPSRWAPEDKVGRHFAAIHAPVADNAVLLAAGESLARLVTGGERWERFVWTITADPRLHQHPARCAARWPAGLDADALAACASWRSERQSFIPIAGTAQAVFTIRVASVPLVAAVTSPADAGRVHAALASMSADVLAYKGLADARDRLLDWLDSRRAPTRAARA